MMDEQAPVCPGFRSKIRKILSEFVAEKNGLGYKYTTGIRYLHNFDQFLVGKRLSVCALPRALVEEWTRKTEQQSAETHRARVRLIRQIAEFMVTRGYNAYIQDPKLRPLARLNFAPYIFTHYEISRLIAAADSLKPQPSSPHRHIVIPELFRLLYGCGLRLGEALRLTLDDVDFKEGILVIRESKFRKDRLVPVDPELTARLKRLEQRLGNRIGNAYLFPSPRGTKYCQTAIRRTFFILLSKIGIVHRGRGKGPRLHDLRHTFAVHRLQKWYQEGCDLSFKLPILTAYMGHTTITGTQRYLHLTLELSTELSARLDREYGNIIPGRQNS